MWLMTVYGFFSATKLPGQNNTMMIRARSKAHLKRLKEAFPVQLAKLDIKEWPGRDYPYRLLVDRDDWAIVVSAMVKETEWDNFKEECGKRFGHHSKYLNALHKIWSLMFSTYYKQRPKMLTPDRNSLWDDHYWQDQRLEDADFAIKSESDDDIVQSLDGLQCEDGEIIPFDKPSEDERS